MKHAFRFLFGAALGVAIGYALTLLVRPNHNGRRSNRPQRPPASNRDTGP
jgi:hypothetical protein